MKLIINIQDFVYNNVKEFDTTHNYELNIVGSIKNGIPLPKGHGRLIDADALINKCAYDLDNIFVIDLIDVREVLTIIEADKENKQL